MTQGKWKSEQQLDQMLNDTIQDVHFFDYTPLLGRNFVHRFDDCDTEMIVRINIEDNDTFSSKIVSEGSFEFTAFAPGFFEGDPTRAALIEETDKWSKANCKRYSMKHMIVATVLSMCVVFPDMRVFHYESYAEIGEPDQIVTFTEENVWTLLPSLLYRYYYYKTHLGCRFIYIDKRKDSIQYIVDQLRKRSLFGLRFTTHTLVLTLYNIMKNRRKRDIVLDQKQHGFTFELDLVRAANVFIRQGIRPQQMKESLK